MSEIIDNNTERKEDHSTQNDYIILMNKRIRALKKKCQKIANIEKKDQNSINSDQKKVLETKAITTANLQELETLRDQFVEIFNSEEKKKVPVIIEKQVTVVEIPKIVESKESQIYRLITLLHASQVFDRTRPEGAEARTKFFEEFNGKSRAAKTDTDIDNIFFLLSDLFNNTIDKATDIATKFVSGTNEEFKAGLTYQYLKQVVEELVSSKLFYGEPVAEAKTEEQILKEQASRESENDVTFEEKVEEQVQQKQVQETQVQEQPPVQTTSETTHDSRPDPNSDDGYTVRNYRGRRGGNRGSGERNRGSPRGGRNYNRDYDNRVPRDSGGEYNNRSSRENRPRGRGSQRNQQKD